MTLATTYTVALALAILSTLLLGSWANGLKLAGRWRFELFYFDFSFGLLITSVALAFTLGTMGYDSFTFMDDLMRARRLVLAYGLCAGVIFNLGNMLLVASMSLLGMTLSFLIAFALAIAFGSVLSFIATPSGNPVLIFTGVAVLLVAVLAGAVTHRSVSLLREVEKMKAGEHRTLRPTVSWKGVLLGLGSGILLGSFSPVLDLARAGEVGLGPYALGFIFCLGAFGSAMLFNLYFMNLPVKGEPVELLAYFSGRPWQHLHGFLSGVVWALGMIGAFVLTGSPREALPSPGLTYALAHASPLVAGLWGLVAWNEMRGADSRAIALVALLFFLFAAGVVMLTVGSTYVPA